MHMLDRAYTARIIRFSEGLALHMLDRAYTATLQTFLVFTGSYAETVEIPIKFTPYKHPAFRPRLQQFFL